MMDRAKDRLARDTRPHDKAKEKAEHIGAPHRSVGRAPDADHADRPVRMANPFDALFDPIDEGS